MKRTVLALVAAVSFAACGGGGGGDDDMQAADAGVDATPMATGNTAKGIFPPAEAMAKAALPGAVLFTIDGQGIGTDGTIDPSTNQSWWRYTFVDLGLGKKVDIFVTAGEYHVSGPSDMNTETLKVFTTDWIDSSTAIEKMVAQGFMAPGMYDRIDTSTFVFVGDPMDFRSMIPEPFWRVTKLHIEPGMNPTGEEWWVTYSAADNGYIVCSPLDGMCYLLM